MSEFSRSELNETQKVQRVVLIMPTSEEPLFSINYIATLAGTKLGIAKKTLHTAQCTKVERTGGPLSNRKEKDPKTVLKTFDAITELAVEGVIPIKCRKCRFANTGTIFTAKRNRDTASGCIILDQRRLELSSSY